VGSDAARHANVETGYQQVAERQPGRITDRLHEHLQKPRVRVASQLTATECDSKAQAPVPNVEQDEIRAPGSRV